MAIQMAAGPRPPLPLLLIYVLYNMFTLVLVTSYNTYYYIFALLFIIIVHGPFKWPWALSWPPISMRDIFTPIMWPPGLQS